MPGITLTEARAAWPYKFSSPCSMRVCGKVCARYYTGQEGLAIVGEATDEFMIIDLARQLSPDLILFDMEMPGLPSLEMLRRFHAELPTVKVMALAIHSDKRFVRETLKAGCGRLFVEVSGP